MLFHDGIVPIFGDCIPINLDPKYGTNLNTVISLFLTVSVLFRRLYIWKFLGSVWLPLRFMLVFLINFAHPGDPFCHFWNPLASFLIYFDTFKKSYALKTVTGNRSVAQTNHNITLSKKMSHITQQETINMLHPLHSWPGVEPCRRHLDKYMNMYIYIYICIYIYIYEYKYIPVHVYIY